jgi:hypothetical protein
MSLLVLRLAPIPRAAAGHPGAPVGVGPGACILLGSGAGIKLGREDSGLAQIARVISAAGE